MVTGPTASGKSALALALARRWNGIVINADSLQVYRDLRILSARPGAADEARVPHRLYGVLDGAEACSVARWLEMAGEAMAETRAQGRLPVLCGGTGLYLKTARDGLAAVPPVPEAVRAEARARLEHDGPASLHADLARRDPGMAERLRPTDGQRIARAWEVIVATGRSLALWWQEPALCPPLPGRPLTVLVDPPRAVCRAACDARLETMVRTGALDEVARLLARDLDPALPVMRAVGLPELALHVEGSLSLPEALARAQAATRQYAKRQATWARHQLAPDRVISKRLDAQDSESEAAAMDNFIRQFLLTPSA
ncbi:tRNA dimethylallyltransferase [Pararhodospirillum oryzae]|uniref:tRNA dimethylallyltransferase n=1 Tax=Pararhodospirillum oryzae TaxID=478448 RepID=A0A512HB59_9PROT|nr:tRNA dimethylallyltransferase [Pararhodospirillum oryzae]